MQCISYFVIACGAIVGGAALILIIMEWRDRRAIRRAEFERWLE